MSGSGGVFGIGKQVAEGGLDLLPEPLRPDISDPGV